MLIGGFGAFAAAAIAEPLALRIEAAAAALAALAGAPTLAIRIEAAAATLSALAETMRTIRVETALPGHRLRGLIDDGDLIRDLGIGDGRMICIGKLMHTHEQEYEA